MEADARGLRHLADNLEEVLVATSCSKSFGLYRERTGAAMVIGASAEKALNAKGKLLNLARSTYTMPPDHGAAIVEMILGTPALRNSWEAEVAGMNQRIVSLRQALAKALRDRIGDNRFDFIEKHKGMFSVVGFSTEQVKKLKDEHAIYAVGDSRINIAGLSETRIDYLADAMVMVSR